MRKCFYNGGFVDESEAKVSIYDSALMFGDMVFEMTRSFNKNHFRLDEHIDRLLIGAKILRIPIAHSKKELIEICEKVSEMNEPIFSEIDEHRLMINVSRGPLGIYSHLFEDPKPTVIVSDFPLKWTVVGMGRLFDGGINGVITRQRAISNNYLDPRIKNRSRLHYQVANIEASFFEGDDNWPILLDEHGYIAEGSGDNIFFVKDEVVYTPKGHNILRGISRQYVMELCESLGIECLEKDVTPYDAYTADECFFTATPFCMLPVTSINYLKISDGMGRVTKTLLKCWSDTVGVDIPAQIKAFNEEYKTISDAPTPYVFKK